MADQGALGLIETRGLVAALEAADAAAKAASVQLVGIRKTVPALMTVQLRGETAAVRSAVDAGRAAAERVGEVVATHVIPRPDPDVARMQAADGAPEAKAPAPSPRRASAAPKAKAEPETRPASTEKPAPAADLESMTVRELRALARETEGIPLQGRAIARASKAELLDALRR